MYIFAAAITNPLHITTSGVIVAMLFLASIVGVLVWMLRLPQETEQERIATRAVRSVDNLTRILVPLLHRSETTDRVVVLAALMAHHRKGNVEVLTVVEVPLTLPLDARVEEYEKEALAALERAEAVAMHSGIRVEKRMLKARNAGPAIVREAEDKAVDLIILANHPVRIRGSVQQIDPAVEYVMKNAPCEVLVLSHVHTAASTNSTGTTVGVRETIGVLS